LSTDYNAAAAEVTARATNSGAFLVVIGDGSAGRGLTSDYQITLVKSGEAFEVSPTDEGGTLVNGTSYAATLTTGDLDAWSFTANAGETVLVRVGESAAGTMNPWLRLYDPSGVLVSSDYNAAAAEAIARATNSGTFLAVIGDGNAGLGGAGNYRISLAKTGAPVIF
jgi:hypothetical protein